LGRQAMVSWLVDHSALGYLFLGILVLVMACLWWINRKRHYLLGLMGAIGLVAVLWLLTLFVVTDRAQIVHGVQAMAQAIEQRNLDHFFKHVSSSFDHQGMNAQQFRGYVESQLQRYKVTSFSVSKIAAYDVSRQSGKGNADFWISLEGNWEGQVLPLRCETLFVLEANEWRLKGFRLFVSNTTQEFRLPAH
jgi:hypothetical protein